MKLAPLAPALSRQHDIRIVHTGQHYDSALSAGFFVEYGLPDPEFFLGISEESRLRRLARTLGGLEPIINGGGTDLIVVIGDSDPAYAGAIAAATAGIPLAHIEAGLRSSDDGQAEERNRRCIDSLAKLHFAPTENCADNLRRENAPNAIMSGDLHLDAVMSVLPTVRHDTAVSTEFGIEPGQYLLATVHRKSMLGSAERLSDLCDALAGCHLPVIWPVHPGALHMLRRFSLTEQLEVAGNVILAGPQSHARLLSLLCHSRAVLTDSGGLQREAFFLERPCVVLRSATEFPETIAAGGAVLTHHDPMQLREAIAAMSEPSFAFTADLAAFGGGKAAKHILDELANYSARDNR